ncbi:hypothetical protein E1200_21520 [Actinomadura sp. GC306]|nr:hypothetical protein E1200_21520 [Actinomadura sp. GC306]
MTLQPPPAEPTAETPAGPPASPARGRPPWQLIVPAAVFTAALAAAVVTVVAFTSQGQDPGRENRARGTTSSPAAPGGVPDGYRRYQGPAFTAAVPEGWKEEGSGDDVTFTDPAQGVKRGVSIQRVASSPQGDLADGLADAAQKTQDDPDYPGYRQESFKRDVPYQGGRAAELQFTFARDGVPTRVRVRVFELGGAVYQAILIGDQQHWDEGVPYYETVLRTLRGPS